METCAFNFWEVPFKGIAKCGFDWSLLVEPEETPLAGVNKMHKSTREYARAIVVFQYEIVWKFSNFFYLVILYVSRIVCAVGWGLTDPIYKTWPKAVFYWL